MSWYIYKKEMLDALRDRKTILLTVLIPVLFNLALVLFFDRVFLAEKVDTYEVAVQENTDPQLIDWLEEIDNIDIVVNEEPNVLVENGEAQVAIQTDVSFSDKLVNHENPSITMFFDPASQKASTAADTINSHLESKKQQVIIDSLADQDVDPSLLQPFTITQETTSGEDNEMSLYMITIFAQLILVLSVIMGEMSIANDLFAGEKERKTMEALLMTPVNRLHIIVGKWLAISSLGVISGIFSLLTFVIGVMYFTEKLYEAMNIHENLSFFVTSLGVGLILFAVLVASLLIIFSLIANTMKEGQNYMAPLSSLAMVPYFLLISQSPNELTDMHFLIPFMNIFALIKQLIYGIYDFQSILYVIVSSVFFIALSFGIAYTMFRKSKWVLGK
ncbi:ABC transporter permease [Bacillus litorisediminis]|uniref:ABC transporter permease n=1 Tax=Bacillus litorisediminis TaxID=2922713 RepID=UPI001FADF395|nr:ABC transporter permease [Bacillus litorisediminis]